MKARHALLVALAAAVTLTSVAAAGPDAAKQRVAIYMKIYPGNGRLCSRPLQPGTLKRDSGTISSNWMSIPGRKVMRDGQEVYDLRRCSDDTHRQARKPHDSRAERVGRRRKRRRRQIAIGTWKVVRGTGQYAGIVGKGRGGHAGLGSPWYARYEGFLTLP